MKSPTLLIVITTLLLTVYAACNTQHEVVQPSVPDPNLITKIELKPQHHQLLADGHAVLDLTPQAYTMYNGTEGRIPPRQVQTDWWVYSSPSGAKIERYFKTTDATLIGKEITVTVALKNNPKIQASAKFKVIAPPKERSTKTFPIIFHVFQPKGAEISSGLSYHADFFAPVILKLNNVFGGKVSNYPVGVNTNIQFAAACYAPNGAELTEPGVHIVTVEPNEMEAAYSDPTKLIEKYQANWSPQKYLNVWLFPANPIFSDALSGSCAPKYVYPNAISTLPGLNTLPPPVGPAIEYHEGTPLNGIFNAGIIYQLNELRQLSRSYSAFYGTRGGNNELIYYIGRYFGLLPNNVFQSETPGEDYCDDTIGYFASKEFFKGNESEYKETPEHFFKSENIMDDPKGFHTSVTLKQAERMHRVAESCPDRFSWKSSFALTGK